MNRRSFLKMTGPGCASLFFSQGASWPAAGTGELRAGAFQIDITPPLAMPLAGIIAQGIPSTHVHDPLNVRCLALDNGHHQLAFAVCDIRMISRKICDRAKALASKRTGISADRMLVSATHSHSAPTPVGVIRDPLPWPRKNPEMLEAYEDFLAYRIADGIQCAFNSLVPAEVGWGKGSVPQHVFNRRWFVKPEAIPENPLGDKNDQVRMNPPAGSPELLEPAGPTDPEVSVLMLRRRDQTPIALLANYGLHYVGGIPSGHISADYFGAFSRRLASLLDVCDLDPPFVGIMSNGTSGDINNIDFRRPRQRRSPYERMKQVAADVADNVIQTIADLEFTNRVVLDSRQHLLRLGVRLPTPEELRRAHQIVENLPLDGRQLTRPEIYARETVFMSARPPIKETVIQAFRVGELGIGALGCEVFAETGLEIKRESPLPATFTIELANDYAGYLPSPRQHRLGGYETWRARSSYLEVEAAPKLSGRLLALFDEMS